MKYSHGGKLQDLPRPHRRRWPDSPDKRRVRVKINSWVGISIGAKHTYLEIQEEHNPIWDERGECWRECWDDLEGEGFECKLSVMTEAQAIRIGRAIVREMFTEATHAIEWEGRKTVRRPARVRDGD